MFWQQQILKQREAEVSPVDSIVIIRSTEKLDLFKSGGAGEGAGDGRVKAQEGMKGRRTFSRNSIITNTPADKMDRGRRRRRRWQLTCFLWSNDQELGQLVAGFLFGPDVFVSLVMTGILKTKKGLRSFLLLCSSASFPLR